MASLKGKERAKASIKKRLKSKNSFFLKKKALLSLIKKWDDPILKKVCSPVLPDEDVSGIVKDLKNVLAASKNGVGLSASQIGYDKRIFVIKNSGYDGSMSVLINSRILKESEERDVYREGCLSYPDFYAPIERPVELTVEYEDENRKLHEKVFKGMEARIVCHEHDHTYGICLVGDNFYKESTSSVKERGNEVAKTVEENL